MGVWGRAPSGVQGQSPWSGGQGGPEAESILVIECPTEPANLAAFHMLCYGPLVSELSLCLPLLRRLWSLRRLLQI